MLASILRSRKDAGGCAHLRAPRRADGYLVLTEAARAAFSSGDIATSRTLYAQAVTAARAARVNDIATSLVAEQALGNALVGDTSLARGQLQQAFAGRREASAETMWTGALAAAFLGRTAQAVQLTQAYQQLAPPAPGHVGRRPDEVGVRRAGEPRWPSRDWTFEQRNALRGRGPWRI